MDSNAAPYRTELEQLGVTALCTNRHLSIQMLRGQSGGDFSMELAAPVTSISCITTPTEPRPAQADGELGWRIVSHLSLNYLSLLDDPANEGALALRQLLGLYVDGTDAIMRKQIEGIRSTKSRRHRAARRVPGRSRSRAAWRFPLLFDETAFEGFGIFILGAVIEQFFTRYVSLNSFTETVIKSQQRGESHAMETQDRPTTSDLADQLEQTPFAFDFFRAIRLLESPHAFFGEGSARRMIRVKIRSALGRSPSLAFAPSALEAFRRGKAVSREKCWFASSGFSDQMGRCPLHLTEYAHERQLQAKDNTFVEFCDMFHHRLLSLFYRAWAVNQKSVDFDRAGQIIRTLLPFRELVRPAVSPLHRKFLRPRDAIGPPQRRNFGLGKAVLLRQTHLPDPQCRRTRRDRAGLLRNAN